MISLLGHLLLFGVWFMVAAAVGVAVGVQLCATQFERHARQAMDLANGGRL